MKLKLKACIFSLIFALCALNFGCAAPKTCILEAEKAVAEPAYDSSVAAESRANSRSENVTSGGKYIGKMYSGNTITWFFNAERQDDCEIKIAVANADENSEGFIADGNVFSVNLNGASIIAPKYTIAAGTKYCDSWQVLSIGSFKVKPGINRLVYTALSDTDRLNVDYISIESDRAEVSEHSHFWKTSPAPATCTEDGSTVKICNECDYSCVSEIIPALGHKYGNFHYDGETQKMVAKCERCTSTLTANTPTSKYFGEVYYSETDFSVRDNELLYEAEEAFVCLKGGLSTETDTYIGKDDGTKNNPSGGKCVESISSVGNNITFKIEAQKACSADLVLRMSNTLYTPTGIAELNPMSDYVYCKVNDVNDVDFTFVSFPGFDDHSYFEWRYVVIKDVELSSGDNSIEIGPKEHNGRITMPNCDVLKIYTDEDILKAVKCYDINDITRGRGYDGNYENSVQFDKKGSFVLHTGAAAEKGDLAITVETQKEIANLASRLSLAFNDGTVNLEGVTLEEGVNVLTLKGVAVKLLKNILEYKAEGEIEITSVTLYTPEEIPLALGCALVPENDYIATEGQENRRKPAFIFEAEDADLGDSVSSRDGVELIELNVYENTGKKASGNTTIGNFAVKDNTITWKFTSSASVLVDIVLMVSSANYSSELNGNTYTDNLQDKIVVTVNGVAVKLDDIVLTVDSLANYYDWKALTISSFMLKDGVNEVTIRALGYGVPNMDVLYVYADGATFEKV